MTFEEYMAAVDSTLDEMVSLESSDLPDIDYYAHYENGNGPTAAANEALRYAGYYS